jgi:hypothetical protein
MEENVINYRDIEFKQIIRLYLTNFYINKALNARNFSKMQNLM